MVAITIVVIAVLNVLNYQYHAVIHFRIAQVQMTTICTAQLISQDWKNSSGSEPHDSTELGLGFE